MSKQKSPVRDYEYYVTHPDDIPKYWYHQPLDGCKPLITRHRHKDGSLTKVTKKNQFMHTKKRKLMDNEEKEANIAKQIKALHKNEPKIKKVPIPVVEVEYTKTKDFVCS